MNAKTILLAAIVVAGLVAELALVGNSGPETSASASDSASEQKTLTASAAPAWELKDVNGAVVRSSDFAGKVVILDFWATWCGPCRMEIPGFVELQNQYRQAGLVVVGVSMDDDPTAVVKPFMTKMEMNYLVVMGDERIVKSFGGIEGIPTTFIIDRSGRIVKKHVGYAPKAVFDQDVQPLLKK